MSRDRFRKWKLFKYNVPGALEASQGVTRGHAAGKDVATRKASRQRSAQEGSEESRVQETAQTVAAPAVPYKSLASPRIFLLPETVISLTQQFVDCQLQRHQRYRLEKSMEWWWAVESAVRLVEAKKLQEGFRELNHCFDRFAAMLKDPEIGLLPNFYNMLIRLGPLLGGNLLTYATQMAMIKLGRGHPLTLVFNTLRRAGPQEVRDGGYMMIRTHFQAAERALGGTDAKVTRLSAHILQALDWHHVDSHLPADSATIEADMWRAYKQLLAAGAVEEAKETLGEIAMMYVRYRRYDEAKRLADQIAGGAEGSADFEVQRFQSRASRVRYLIARETDDIAACFFHASQSLQYNFRNFGRAHHRPEALLAQYQAHLREKGHPELAAKLELEIAGQEGALSGAHGVEVKREDGGEGREPEERHESNG